MKLLFRRAHTPDVEALSAYADGALDVGSARALETHLSTCEACTARLSGLRTVTALLASMPQPEAPRSFRLRQAEAATPSRAAAGFSNPLLRAMPVLAATAAVLFVIVLGTDVATQNSGGARQAASPPSSDSSAEGKIASGPPRESQENASAASPLNPTAAAGAALQPQPFAADGALLGGPTATSGGDGAPLPGRTIDRNFRSAPTVSPPEAMAPAPAATQPASAATSANDTEANRSTGEGDDGNRIGFRIVEITAAVVALGGAAWYATSRMRTKEGRR